MKKLFAIVLIAIIAAGFAMPVLAQGNPPDDGYLVDDPQWTTVLSKPPRLGGGLGLWKGALIFKQLVNLFADSFCVADVVCCIQPLLDFLYWSEFFDGQVGVESTF